MVADIIRAMGYFINPELETYFTPLLRVSKFFYYIRKNNFELILRKADLWYFHYKIKSSILHLSDNFLSTLCVVSHAISPVLSGSENG